MTAHQLPTISNPEIFEDLICDLFNLLESTNTFKKFGKSGNKQKGIDIISTEKDIAIQCKKKDLKRKEISLKKELLNDIENDVSKFLSENVKIGINKFYFVSTFNDHPDFDEFCDELKETHETNFEIIYWGWETLESKILEQKSLLEKYWPNFIISEKSNENELLRNLELKRRIKEDFGPWINYAIENRKRRSRMIIRDYSSSQYPNTNEPDAFGKYPWFGAEIKRLYHQGIEFYEDPDHDFIEIFEDNSWDFANENSVEENIVLVGKVSRISFSDIVDYDINGDEYYNCPHIYCRFKYNGTPYEDSYYYNIKRTFQTFEFRDKRLHDR